jgi:hypothetical protein
MDGVVQDLLDTGLEVLDLQGLPSFTKRRLHDRNITLQMEGLVRLSHIFVENPEMLLQNLVQAAVDICGADSAGISLELPERTDDAFYRWVATAGEYSHFLDAALPRYPSACGICLERNQPQLFRVDQRFFDLMGVTAPPVTDGILLPWQADELRGTIWIMAHRRSEAFDLQDVGLMQVLADFAAMGVRHQQQSRTLLEQTAAAAAAAVSNELAHQINNPLQSLTNLVYLVSQVEQAGDARDLAQDLSHQVQRLSLLVNQLLAVPGNAARLK